MSVTKLSSYRLDSKTKAILKEIQKKHGDHTATAAVEFCIAKYALEFDIDVGAAREVMVQAIARGLVGRGPRNGTPPPDRESGGSKPAKQKYGNPPPTT